jgi:hypothetical protein
LLDRINNTFMDGFLRTGHLVAAMLFAGLVALHIYFAVLPQNRPFLRAISFGKAGTAGDNSQQAIRTSQGVADQGALAVEMTTRED